MGVAICRTGSWEGGNKRLPLKREASEKKEGYLLAVASAF